ncbi:MAG: Gfo/Idh/MocA family protein [Planctomycetota bacterium]
MDRRSFLKSTTAGIGLFSIVPSYVLGQNGKTPPSGKLNIAAIGVGGIGQSNLKVICKPLSERQEEGTWPDPDSQNIVALCDVDWEYAKETFEEYPEAKRYKDYRIMLEEMGDKVDAVLIATPDHTHACIAMEAMRHGKHVYVQKPLTHSVRGIAGKEIVRFVNGYGTGLSAMSMRFMPGQIVRSGHRVCLDPKKLRQFHPRWIGIYGLARRRIARITRPIIHGIGERG